MSLLETHAPRPETVHELGPSRARQVLLQVFAVGVIVCSIYSAHDIALACSRAASGVQGPTVLGLDWADNSLSILMPLNAVIVQPFELRRESGEVLETVPIESGPLGSGGFTRTAEPLAPDEVYELGSMRFRTGDFVDDVAPTMPTLLDAVWVDYESGDCGLFDELALEIEAASDDRALPGNLSYAVYFGGSEDAVRTASIPAAVVPASNPTVSLHGGQPHFVAIEAIDSAGNVSPRTTGSASRYAQSGGCAIATPGTRSTPALLACFALSLLALARAKRRLYRE
ncbi:MAG: hypothetical protein JRH11_28060 [Deltaproteobacteria bacterium]|nr:hypothetical protein [Deltaproteobacteria bacterium]